MTTTEIAATGSLTCAECGTQDAETYMVTVLDEADPQTTRTEVCAACHKVLTEKPWLVLNCFITQVLGEYDTKEQAEAAAAEFGNCSFAFPRRS